MQCIILAAGHGKRLRPITAHTPKPLIKIGDTPLIAHHIRALKARGIDNIIINTHYLAEQIHQYLQDGAQFGVNIRFSNEPDQALETGGGIRQAMDMIDDDVFLVINGDIFCDYPFETLTCPDDLLAQLVLVENPKHNTNGDFCIKNKRLQQHSDNQRNFTFSGIGCYHKRLFNHLPYAIYPLKTVLDEAIKSQAIGAEIYSGYWNDVGTVERLNETRQYYQQLQTDHRGKNK